MQQAYAGPPPAAVRERLETLRRQPAETFYDCPVLEHDERRGRYAIRLGNQSYPHMKLAVEKSADGEHVFFKPDTHDKQCCPAPASREYNAFLGLMQENEKIAKQVELAWAQAGIPTFREYLRKDLARRLMEG